MYLVLALLLQASPVPGPLLEARAVVVNGLDAFDRDIGVFTKLIDTRFDADAPAPKLGIVIASAEDPDENGLHALTVENVVKDAPADVAGISTGDRIVAVGPRRITHETEKVFRLLAERAAGPIELTVRRNGIERTVIVNRTPLACLQRASSRIDLTKWHTNVAQLRHVSDMIRSEIDNEAVGPPEYRYRVAKDHVVRLYGLIGELGQAFSNEMLSAAAAECMYRVP